ncbi:MAG: hypothetical protein ABJ004_18000 [Cyclobacteriaceae bacterium]
MKNTRAFRSHIWPCDGMTSVSKSEGHSRMESYTSRRKFTEL